MVEDMGCRLTSAIDADRRFVVSFYLDGGGIQVFEPPVRNSGIQGGKVVEKIRVRTPAGEGYYGAADVHMGARLLVHGRCYELGDADEATLALMESSPEAFPRASFEAVAGRVAGLLRARPALGERLRELAAWQDGAGTGYLRTPQLLVVLQQLGLEDASLQEALALVRAVGGNNEAAAVADLLPALGVKSGEEAGRQQAPPAAGRPGPAQTQGGRGGEPTFANGMGGAPQQAPQQAQAQQAQGRPSDYGAPRASFQQQPAFQPPQPLYGSRPTSAQAYGQGVPQGYQPAAGSRPQSSQGGRCGAWN